MSGRSSTPARARPEIPPGSCPLGELALQAVEQPGARFGIRSGLFPITADDLAAAKHLDLLHRRIGFAFLARDGRRHRRAIVRAALSRTSPQPRRNSPHRQGGTPPVRLPLSTATPARLSIAKKTQDKCWL